jgi:ribosomal protein S18 acetylase RimI-like enzyme
MWTTVEQARITWGLPGFVTIDDGGSARAWSFHFIDDRVLRIGGLVAESEAATTQLVDASMRAARAADVDVAACFIPDRAVGLRPVLETRGFACERFDYMARPLAAPSAAGRRALAVEPWDGDRRAAATLLHGAYSRDEALHFTAGGTVDDWCGYLSQVIEQTGCGTFDPASTVMIRNGHDLIAFALMTSLAAGTAHLAQLAVRADHRGRGIATQLLNAAMDRAAQQGRSLITLLVAGRNSVALRTYGRLGFEPRSTFLAGRADLTPPDR